MAGKLYRKPFLSGKIRSTRRLQLVHSDFSGSLHAESFGGVLKHLVTFIDDYTRSWAVYITIQDYRV